VLRYYGCTARLAGCAAFPSAWRAAANHAIILQAVQDSKHGDLWGGAITGVSPPCLQLCAEPVNNYRFQRSWPSWNGASCHFHYIFTRAAPSGMLTLTGSVGWRGLRTSHACAFHRHWPLATEIFTSSRTLRPPRPSHVRPSSISRLYRLREHPHRAGSHAVRLRGKTHGKDRLLFLSRASPLGNSSPALLLRGSFLKGSHIRVSRLPSLYQSLYYSRQRVR
jgi:hypothetical protein